MSVGLFSWQLFLKTWYLMNWRIRKFLNKECNFWASSSNPEGLKAWGSNKASRCPWELTGADDLKAVMIQSSLTLILSWEQETAPDNVPVFNYTLPQHRWLQCWGIKSIHAHLWQVLGVKVISAPPTSPWAKKRGQRAGKTTPLSSWYSSILSFLFLLTTLNTEGKGLFGLFQR